MVLFKTFEEAAVVVDEMFESTKADADDSGDESGDEEDRTEADKNEDGDQGSEHVRIIEASLSFAVTYPVTGYQ
jgi:hypothetical protein